MTGGRTAYGNVCEIFDGNSTPPAVALTGARVHDPKAFEHHIDGVGPARATYFPRRRVALRRRGIKVRAVRRE